MVKFYDTNALLDLLDKAFDDFFYVSDITLLEIENIKSSNKKDEQTKYKARRLSRLLDEYEDKYKVIYGRVDSYIIEDKLGFEPNNDFQIVWQAYKNKDDCIFVTNDISCKNIARNLFKINVESVSSEEEEYFGYKEVEVSEAELAYFYQNIDNNIYDLLKNEYLIIKFDKEIKDILRWDGSAHVPIRLGNFDGSYFGKVRPYKNDIYQQLLFDCLQNNQVTLINGPAGTGKSFIALSFLLKLLEKHKIDRIIIFNNTIATKGAAKLGYYPGTKDEKLLDSQIGNMLASKLGGKYAAERLVSSESIVLLPMSDIRGYDTTGMNCAVYITEAQNLDIELMKLALQRIGENTICVIDGDYNTQVDSAIFEGANNGMKRVSQVFKGEDFFGQVTLKNIYRSKVADVAQKM